MRLLGGYIGRTILATTGLVLFVLLCMGFFIQLIGEFSDIGQGNYGIWQALQFVMLSVPEMIYQIFPMIGLIGVMLGLGLLSNHSELIVMRAAGVSVGKITLAVMVTVLAMVLIVTVLGEFVAPRLLRLGELHKAMEKSGGQAVLTKHGAWVRDKNSFIHIDTVFGNRKLQGVTRYEFDDQRRLRRVSFAREVDFTHHHWVAHDVKGSELSLNGVTSSQQAKVIWPISLKPNVLKVAEVDPEEMSIMRLRTLIQYKQANGLAVNNYKLAFWQRLLQPLASCVMMFLAIPFIFGPMRSVTMGFRLVAGVIVGFGFYLLNQFFGPISLVYELPPLWAALLPTLFFAGAGYMMMRRVR